MIAKHVPMRSLGKSDFAGLAEYITDAQSKTERLGLVTVTNCQAGTVQAATDEEHARHWRQDLSPAGELSRWREARRRHPQSD